MTFDITVTATPTPTGTVTLKDGGSGGTTIGSGTLSSGACTITPALNALTAGSHANIVAVYSGDGTYATSTSSALSTQTVNPRALTMTGSRTYDGTATFPGSSLTISNIVSGDSLTLSGSAALASKNAGAQAINGNATPVRVGSAATGNTGSSASTAISVSGMTATTAGNTLVAVISTRGTSTGRVTGITGGGTWAKAAESANTNGTTTEIWYAPNISAGVTSVSITQASLRSAAIVMEYSGILTASPLDQINAASSTGSSTAASTGTTPATLQASELWVGGIGFINSTPTLGIIQNSFGSITSSQSTNATTSNNAKVYALEYIASATSSGVSSGGTLSISAQWSGAIATFKAASTSLGGTAAANYTLTGASGSVTINAKALTVASAAVTSKTYTGTNTATITGAALQSSETAGTGTTSDGKSYTGDTVTLGNATSGTFTDANVANGKSITTAPMTISGAQAGNYTLTQPTLTGNITTATLTVTASAQSKTYGQTLAFGSGSTLFTSSGLQNGETIGSVTLACAGGGSSAPVGPYTITPSAASGGSFTAGNYDLAYHTGTLTVMTAYDSWIASYPALTGADALPDADPDHDGLTNEQEHAFGTDPTNGSSGPGAIAYANGVVTAHGQPIVQDLSPGTGGVDFRAVFGRRKDYQAAGITYTVQFSADNVHWVTITATPRVDATDATIDAVSVPHPLFIVTTRGVEKPTFFRVAVSSN